MRAKVGNYPGVTVERREGSLNLAGHQAVIMDLPGTYSLDPISPDEAVVTQVLAGEIEGVAPPEALIVVADACSLERSLLLITQVLAQEKPTCLVLTMMDELAARGGSLDTQRLEAALGIPVVPVVGHRGHGIRALRERLADPEAWSQPQVLPPRDRAALSGWVDSVMTACSAQRPAAHALTERIDRVVVHPILGSLLFLFVMLTFFQLIFAWATPAMDGINDAMGWASEAVRNTVPPGLLADFLADGLIAGVGSVIVFLPQIVLLFALLYLLEDVGYMARAAFVVDRAMARIGLEGRAFGPIGLQGLVLFGLYFIAPLAAMTVAAVLRRSLLPGEGMPFTLELPSYRMPSLGLWLSQVGGSAWAFVRRAGTIILVASVVLWMLLTFPRTPAPPDLEPEAAAAYALEHSAAGRIGKAIEPAIAPLGFDWKIGVGLLASLAAREVFVSTLAQVYATEDPDASLREAIRADIDPTTGRKIFTPPTVAALLTFFIFALQCTSTIATMARETNSWRWPAFAFGYMLALAYGFAFLARTVTAALI